MIKYEAEPYDGTKTGKGGYNFKRGIQIVATDAVTGARRYVFIEQGEYRTYKTPCLKLWEGVAHYKSGLNKTDQAEFDEVLHHATVMADEYNRNQPF